MSKTKKLQAGDGIIWTDGKPKTVKAIRTENGDRFFLFHELSGEYSEFQLSEIGVLSKPLTWKMSFLMEPNKGLVGTKALKPGRFYIVERTVAERTVAQVTVNAALDHTPNLLLVEMQRLMPNFLLRLCLKF